EGLALEAPAALGDAVEEGVHEPGVEEIALHLDHPLAHPGEDARRGGGPPRAGVRQVERQALGRTAGEDELRERADDRLETPAREPLAERRASEVRDVRLSGDDG